MIWLDLLYNKSEALSIFHPRESRAFQRFHFKARFVFLWGQELLFRAIPGRRSRKREFFVINQDGGQGWPPYESRVFPKKSAWYGLFVEKGEFSTVYRMGNCYTCYATLATLVGAKSGVKIAVWLYKMGVFSK